MYQQPMITHIVCWKLKAEAEGATAAGNRVRMQELLTGLKAKLPQIVDLSCGTDFNRSPAAYDFALYTTFRSVDDLKAYQVHPDHQAVAQFIGKVTAERVVVDYES